MLVEVKPKRKPKEPKEPNKSRVIAVAANPTEYVDDQAPPTPPPTYATPATLDVIEQQLVVFIRHKAKATYRAKVKAKVVAEPVAEPVVEPVVVEANPEAPPKPNRFLLNQPKLISPVDCVKTDCCGH